MMELVNGKDDILIHEIHVPNHHFPLSVGRAGSGAGARPLFTSSTQCERSLPFRRSSQIAMPLTKGATGRLLRALDPLMHGVWHLSIIHWST